MPCFRTFLFALLALLAVPLGVENAVGSPVEREPFRPEAHRWRHRLLLVFAPSAAEPALRQQQARWDAAREGFAERQLLPVAITGKDSPANAAALRRQFGVPLDGFQVLLIGKDGGVKLRQSEPVATEALFALVDSMPMRQDEMRRGNPR